MAISIILSYQMEIREYKKELERRSRTSRVYRNYQLTGLVIARMLSDEKHKTLYIQLAKNINNQTLMGIARDVADRNLKKPGAYFMAILKSKKLFRNVKKHKQIKIKLRYKKRTSKKGKK